MSVRSNWGSVERRVCWIRCELCADCNGHTLTYPRPCEYVYVAYSYPRSCPEAIIWLQDVLGLDFRGRAGLSQMEM